jgi:hypothetical protein
MARGQMFQIKSCKFLNISIFDEFFYLLGYNAEFSVERQPPFRRNVSPVNGGDMFFRNVNRFEGTTQRYIPEDRTLHNHRCENLKSYTIILFRGRYLLPIFTEICPAFLEMKSANGQTLPPIKHSFHTVTLTITNTGHQIKSTGTLRNHVSSSSSSSVVLKPN